MLPLFESALSEKNLCTVYILNIDLQTHTPHTHILSFIITHTHLHFHTHSHTETQIFLYYQIQRVLI